jgi:hypothetical protein
MLGRMSESRAPADDDQDDRAPEAEPSWWHRSHPTFASIVGFFTGVGFLILVPGVYAAALGLLLSDDSARRLFPLVAFALLVPLVLLFPRRTRRFAQFMWIGIIATAVVIGVTTLVVIWLMGLIEG